MYLYINMFREHGYTRVHKRLSCYSTIYLPQGQILYMYLYIKIFRDIEGNFVILEENTKQ
jgi:hypothetical protein